MLINGMNNYEIKKGGVHFPRFFVLGWDLLGWMFFIVMSFVYFVYCVY